MSNSSERTKTKVSLKVEPDAKNGTAKATISSSVDFHRQRMKQRLLSMAQLKIEKELGRRLKES